MKRGPKGIYDRMGGPIIPGQRALPPDDLEPDEAAEWNQITARLPDGWFTAENMPMLTQLCRHICYARWLAGAISSIRGQIRAIEASSDPVALGSEKAEAMLSDRLRSFLRAHCDQSERISNISTKLRLTQGSRYTLTAARAASAAGDSPTGRKPWEGWRDPSDREQ